MTVVMSYRGHQETALQTPPDTTAQKIHDAAQNLDVKLRAVSTGWAFLSALQFFELNITELSGRLRVLVQCLQPRFAVKTLPVREGQWFTDLELCQKGFATIDSEAAMFRTLYPDTERLLGLCEKLAQSAKALPVEQSVPLSNTIDALRASLESSPLKVRIQQLESQLAHEHSLVAAGAVQDRSGELEAKLAEAKAVLAALED
jgi:hypothetical protein